MRLAACVGLAVAFLAGCGTTTARYGTFKAIGAPAWIVTGESPDYPRDRFLSGLGRGATPEVAEDAARAEVAKVFEVRVEGRTGQSASYSESEDRRGTAWERSASVDQAVQTETSKVLSGVEIVARFSGDDGCSALAVLSRAGASAALHDRATALAREADRLWAEGRSAADALVACRAFWQATHVLARLDAVNDDLRVLGLRPPVAAAARTAEAWQAFRDRVARDVGFSLAVEGRDAERLKAALASALSASGVALAPEASARVAIRGSCAMRRNDRPPNDWIFVRYDLALGAKDTLTGDVLASVGPVSDDASGKTEDQAYERVAWLLRNRHAEPFVQSLFRRMFGAGEAKEERR